MKSRSMTRVAIAVCAAVLAVGCVAIAEEVGESFPPVHGTFSGGSLSITNGAQPYGITKLSLWGSVSNFSAVVVNVAGYTNTLAEAYTNSLVYEAAAAPAVVWRNGVITLTTTSTNAALYQFYRVAITR